MIAVARGSLLGNTPGSRTLYTPVPSGAVRVAHADRVAIWSAKQGSICRATRLADYAWLEWRRRTWRAAKLGALLWREMCRGVLQLRLRWVVEVPTHWQTTSEIGVLSGQKRWYGLVGRLCGRRRPRPTRVEDRDGVLNRLEVAAYARGEFRYSVPKPALEKILESLSESGQAGVGEGSLVLLRCAVGISRQMQLGQRLRTERARAPLGSGKAFHGGDGVCETRAYLGHSSHDAGLDVASGVFAPETRCAIPLLAFRLCALADDPRSPTLLDRGCGAIIVRRAAERTAEMSPLSLSSQRVGNWRVAERMAESTSWHVVGMCVCVSLPCWASSSRPLQ